jgi:hypothetical protein
VQIDVSARDFGILEIVEDSPVSTRSFTNEPLELSDFTLSLSAQGVKRSGNEPTLWRA